MPNAGEAFEVLSGSLWIDGARPFEAVPVKAVHATLKQDEQRGPPGRFLHDLPGEAASTGEPATASQAMADKAL